MNKSIKTILPLVAFAGLAVSANAAVTSIDFGNGDSQIGEPSHIDGLTLPGAGIWNIMNWSAGNVNTIVTAEGPTFSIGSENVGGWPNGGTDPLRRDYYLNHATNNPGLVIPWSITGLTAGASYDLILYSNSSGQRGLFKIGAVTAPGDSDGDGNFTGVVATGGTISGTFETGGATWGTFAGIQFAPVPEPSTTALLGLGGLALILRRRK